MNRLELLTRPGPPAVKPHCWEEAQHIGLTVRYKVRGTRDGNTYGYFQAGRASITLFTHDPEAFYHEFSHALHGIFDMGTLLSVEEDDWWFSEAVADFVAGAIADEIQDTASRDWFLDRLARNGANDEEAERVMETGRCCYEILLAIRAEMARTIREVGT